MLPRAPRGVRQAGFIPGQALGSRIPRGAVSGRGNRDPRFAGRGCSAVLHQRSGHLPTAADGGDACAC
eukprot:1540039-Pyramimonas_sp.AAC.1